MAGDRMQGRRCASQRVCGKNDQHKRDGFGQAPPGLLTGQGPLSGSASHGTTTAFLFGPPGSSRRCPPKERRNRRQLGLSDAYSVVRRDRKCGEKEGVLMRGGLITHISCWMLGIAAFVAPVSGEPGAEAPDQGPRPALSLRQFEGANIHATLVTEMLAQQEGGPQGPVTTEDDWNLTVEPGGKINWSYRPTTRTRRGTQEGEKIAEYIRFGRGLANSGWCSHLAVQRCGVELRAILPGWRDEAHHCPQAGWAKLDVYCQQRVCQRARQECPHIKFSH